MKNSNKALLLGAVGLALAFGVWIWLPSTKDQTRVVSTKTDQELEGKPELVKRLSRIRQPAKVSLEDKVWAVPVERDDPILGASDALVTIVEFCDFEGPRCAELAANLINAVRKDFARVRLVWKDAPSGRHRRGQIASFYAREVFIEQGTEAFWLAHDKLFNGLLSLREPLGQSIAELLTISQEQRHAEEAQYKIDKNLALAISLGVKETPVLFINGRRVVGAHPMSVLEQLISDEIERVKSQDDQSGYEAIVRDGQKPDLDVAEEAVAFARLTKAERKAREKEKGKGGVQPPELLADYAHYEVSEEELQAVEAKGFDRESYAAFVQEKKREQQLIEDVKAYRASKGLAHLPRPVPRGEAP